MKTTKSPTSFRLPEMTHNQISALHERTGLTMAEIVTTAIDRMYREEIKMNANLDANRIYDMYANQADPAELLKLGHGVIAQQIRELNAEEPSPTNVDPDLAAEAILKIAAELVDARK